MIINWKEYRVIRSVSILLWREKQWFILSKKIDINEEISGMETLKWFFV